MDRAEFTIKLRYFKPSGKWYADGEFTYVGKAVRSGKHGTVPYLPDVVDHVNRLWDAGGPLPGLSGTWGGPILVDAGGVPHLIPGRAVM